MSIRNRAGNLEIPDTFDRDRSLTIAAGAATISLTATDRDRDQQVTITFGTDELNMLAAEILILRDRLNI